MLKYLSETKLIKSVTLLSNEKSSRKPNENEASRLIRAIADNAEIELVEFSVNRVPLRVRDHHVLELLHNKASSLQHLALQGLDTHSWPEDDVAALAETVGELSMLQSLTLDKFPDPELSAMILCRVGSHAHLQKLSIEGNCKGLGWSFDDQAHSDAILHGVSVMLKSLVPLEVLELKNVSFSQEGMECLVPGLETCTSLAELWLEGRMTDEAQQELVRFLRASRSTTTCSIRRLCLRGTLGAPGNFQSILKVNDSELQPNQTSIGASLHSLSLSSWSGDIDELLNVLCTGEHHLSSLSLSDLSYITWLKLTPCLPKLLHLQELSIIHLSTMVPVSSAGFVCSMRENGSLHRVSEISCYDVGLEDHFTRRRSSLFTVLEWQRVQIYCQRNQATQELLQRPFLPSQEAHEGNVEISLSLLPKLFRVMKPARRLAPNLIFVGLLACSGGGMGDCLIGPRDRSKRLAPLASASASGGAIE
jgi:hypothetical protein